MRLTKPIPRALAAAVAGSLMLVGLAPVGSASAAEIIDPDNVLARVAVSPTLNCDVQHRDDSYPEFFDATACATLAVVDGVLYGPADIPAGSNASPRTAFTPLSQTKTGDGTTGNLWKITTRVALGSTGLEIQQVDYYGNGDDEVTTEVTVVNSTGVSKQVRLYRAGDCYLGNSDFGYGAIGANWVACTASTTNRAIQWYDLDNTATRYEGFYGSVWSLIGRQEAFPNTADEETNQDNGAGLSWLMTAPAGGSATRFSSLVFGTSRQGLDSDDDGFTDEQELNGFSVGGENVDLKALGADPDKKDIFLKVAWMRREGAATLWNGFRAPVSTTKPSEAEIEDLKHAFAIAPDTNGPGPVNLHVEIMSDPIADATHLIDAVDPDDEAILSAMRSIQLATMTRAEQRVYHLAIVGRHLWKTSKGSSGTSGIGETPGSVFAVAKSTWGSMDRREFTGTMLHELGHNLELQHGGQDSHNCKPGYESVMNYTYQMAGVDGRVQGVDYGRSPETVRTLTASPECTDSDVVQPGSYTIYNDWQHLNLMAGVGILSAGGVVSTQLILDADLEELRDQALPAMQGRGTANLVIPSVLVRGANIPNQSLQVDVRNLGPSAASYTLRFTSGFLTFEGEVTVPGDSTSRVEVPVPSVSVPSAGSHAATLELLAPGGAQLAWSEADIIVAEPTAAEIAEVQAAISSNSEPGVDPSAAAALAQDLTTVAKPGLQFTDVTTTTQFHDEIMWLAQHGISTGWPDGTYRPVTAINRDAMAAFIYRLAGEPSFTPPATPSFSDVVTSDPFYKEIEWMKAKGLTNGWPDGTYRPLSAINRDAMAAFLYRLNGRPEVAATDGQFSDVSASTEFAKEITWLARTGITTGYSDGTFRPTDPVNRDAMAAFMFRYVAEYGAPTP